MMIIGAGYHPSLQAIAFLIEETGKCGEQELNQSDGQAHVFGLTPIPDWFSWTREIDISTVF